MTAALKQRILSKGMLILTRYSSHPLTGDVWERQLWCYRGREYWLGRIVERRGMPVEALTHLV